MEIITAIKRIIETGKVEFGSASTVKNIINDKAKIVIIASNCPKKEKESIEKYAKIGEIPVIQYPGTALQLGEVCGKPFLVASLSVIDAGNVLLTDLKP